MNFVYGVSASLISTALSTLGLNLQAASLKEKSEFTMNVSLPSTPTLTSPASIMRKQNKRLKMNTLKWYLGFTMYLFFQTLGSVVGLSFIPATVLAVII